MDHELTDILNERDQALRSAAIVAMIVGVMIGAVFGLLVGLWIGGQS